MKTGDYTFIEGAGVTDTVRASGIAKDEAPRARSVPEPVREQVREPMREQVLVQR